MPPAELVDWRDPAPPHDDNDFPDNLERDPDRLVDDSFRPVDLGPVVAGQFRQPEPTILRRDDGLCLFYVGQVNGLHGADGIGKSMAALAAAKQQIAAGRNVLLVDTEDVPTSIVARLRTLGASDDQILRHLVYVRPTAPFGLVAVDHLVSVAIEKNVSMVVIDSLGEAFGLDGVDENSDAEVAPWLRRVARRLADVGPAVVLIDHGTKAGDQPLYPSGSKRKRAAIGGAAYLVEATQPLSIERGGRLRLTCAKDRHGTYARGERVADLVITVDHNGTRWDLYSPSDTPTGPTELPVFLAARSAVDACRDAGEPLSLRRLAERMSIKARAELKRAGIEEAVAAGALTETRQGQARLFTYQTDLPEVIT